MTREELVNSDGYQIVNLHKNGKCVTWGESDCDLFIEIPEESSEKKKEADKMVAADIESFDIESFKKMMSKIQYKFKVGDIVKVASGDRDLNCVGKIITATIYFKDWKTKLYLIDVEKGKRANYIAEENLVLASEEEKEKYKNTKIERKCEFKPYDKVLVREDELDIWECRLFDRFYKERGALGYVCQDGISYDFCIPYEGNEHLVGTTNNPE